mgnify:FL=1
MPREDGAVTTTRPSSQTVLWVIALLLAVIATALIVRTPGPMMVQPAFGDSPMVGARGIFAFTGQLDKNSYGLFMMDVDNRTVWCYQYLPSTRKLKLVAARSFDYDRYLRDYNNETPSQEEVKGLVDDQRRIAERNERGDANDPDDALGITVPGLSSSGGSGSGRPESK